MEFLCVGVPYDGKKVDIQSDYYSHIFLPYCPPQPLCDMRDMPETVFFENHRYDVKFLRFGFPDPSVTVYVHESLSERDILNRLIDNYRPKEGD